MSEKKDQIKKDVEETFRERTPSSDVLNQQGEMVFPGGGTRDVAQFHPYPFYATHGKGCHIYDVDENEYIDCLNNMSALLHGHANPLITERLHDQIDKGTVHAAPMEIQNKLAKLICDRVASVDEIRFCNSGTEATMFALRAARVISGKTKIIKFDGAYHGAHDWVQMNFIPDWESDNPPQPKPEVGFPEQLMDAILITPINDLEKLKEIIANNSGEIAAMIVEPVINMTGIAVTREYIHEVRRLTEENGIFLIFDEVITYRHSLGGFQEILGVVPDFTAFGKIVGGGLPAGAFGGKRELMEWYNPKHEPHIGHSGTFSGNAMTVSAGLAALENYTQATVERMNQLGKLLGDGLREMKNRIGFPAHVTSVGSLVYLHLFEGTYTNSREYCFGLLPIFENMGILNLALLNEGIYVYHKSCLEFILSTAMDETVIDEIVQKVERALTKVKPLFLK